MSKNNFLLVDLNEKKTKKLAETITSNTSRKILNYLADKEHDTEANIAKGLSIPISTVHYHIQKLMEAKLLSVEEFHYSPKGREVNHYKLANKYIIIAPKKVSGLREKLKGILPVALAALGISAVIKFTQGFTASASQKIASAPSASLDAGAQTKGAEAMMAEPTAFIAEKTISTLDIALWFLIGSLTTILLFILITLFRNWLKR